MLILHFVVPKERHFKYSTVIRTSNCSVAGPSTALCSLMVAMREELCGVQVAEEEKEQKPICDAFKCTGAKNRGSVLPTAVHIRSNGTTPLDQVQ